MAWGEETLPRASPIGEWKRLRPSPFSPEGILRLISEETTREEQRAAEVLRRLAGWRQRAAMRDTMLEVPPPPRGGNPLRTPSIRRDVIIQRVLNAIRNGIEDPRGGGGDLYIPEDPKLIQRLQRIRKDEYIDTPDFSVPPGHPTVASGNGEKGLLERKRGAYRAALEAFGMLGMKRYRGDDYDTRETSSGVTKIMVPTSDPVWVRRGEKGAKKKVENRTPLFFETPRKSTDYISVEDEGQGGWRFNDESMKQMLASELRYRKEKARREGKPFQKSLYEIGEIFTEREDYRRAEAVRMAALNHHKAKEDSATEAERAQAMKLLYRRLKEANLTEVDHEDFQKMLRATLKATEKFGNPKDKIKQPWNYSAVREEDEKFNRDAPPSLVNNRFSSHTRGRESEQMPVPYRLKPDKLEEGSRKEDISLPLASQSDPVLEALERWGLQGKHRAVSRAAMKKADELAQRAQKTPVGIPPDADFIQDKPGEDKAGHLIRVNAMLDATGGDKYRIGIDWYRKLRQMALKEGPGSASDIAYRDEMRQIQQEADRFTATAAGVEGGALKDQTRIEEAEMRQVARDMANALKDRRYKASPATEKQDPSGPARYSSLLSVEKERKAEAKARKVTKLAAQILKKKGKLKGGLAP